MWVMKAEKKYKTEQLKRNCWIKINYERIQVKN